MFICGLVLSLLSNPSLQQHASPGDAWPGFRGVGTGWTRATELPQEWSEPTWSFDLPGEGQSSPVILDGRVFVTSIEGDNKELAFVTCLRLSDGLPLWIRSFRACMQSKLSDMVSKSAPTPTVDADGLYVFFESGDFFGLDHDGNEKWHRDLYSEYGPFEGNHGVGSSPVLAGGSVLILLDHSGPSHLICLDTKTGENRWLVERDPRVSWASPVVHRSEAGGEEIIVSSNGVVQAYAVADGSKQWEIDGIQGNTVPSPIAMTDHVLVGQSKGSGMTLIQRARGDEKAAVVWAGDSLPPSGFGSPLVFGDAALLVNRAGVLSSVSMKNGDLLWKARLSSGGTWASPITDGELVWFFGKEGVTSVVRWKAEGLEEVAVNELEVDGTVHGVAANDGVFVMRESSRVFAVARPAEPAAETDSPVRDASADTEDQR